MKLFITLTLLAAGLATPMATAVECTAMSFNVRFGTAKDGENAWELRRDFLVDTIRSASPDVIGTQECLEFQAEYITEQLPEYGWVGLGREAAGTGEMTAVLYRKSALVPVKTSHLWLSEDPHVPGSKSWDSSLPRIATRVEFYHVAAKAPFVFYNTHFDHLGEVARLESAKLMGKWIAAESLPVILTGDFNDNAVETQSWQTLTTGGLFDAWQIADSTQGPNNTWNGFKQPAPDDNRRIDWILVSSGINVASCVTQDHQRDGRFPSDHFPVIAVLNLPLETDTP